MSVISGFSRLRWPVKALLGAVVAAILVFAVNTFVSDKPASGASGASSSSSASGGGFVSNLFGGADYDLNVCVNTWGGFAGGQWYNGGFEPSDTSKFATEQGIKVKFTKMDDFDASRAAWKSGECHLVWATVDSFVAEADALTDDEPVVPFQIDWSRGGDVVVAVRGINSINDLRGKRVGVALGTPSHSLLLWLLNSSGLGEKSVNLVQMKGEPDVVAAFKAGQLDAGLVWSPDDQDAVAAVPGAKVLVSTKQATDIIADTLLVKRSFFNENKELLTKLYTGWMIGNATVNSSPQAFSEAVQITAQGYGMSPDFMETAIRNVRLTTHGDNKNFFGLNAGFTGMKADELYGRTGMLYQESGFVTGFPSWRRVSDSSIVAAATGLDGPQQVAENTRTFTPAAPEVQRAVAVAAKPVIVTFASGSAALDDANKSIIDRQLVNMARQFRTSYIRIEGNTDSTGDVAVNTRLSRQRANAVAQYLIESYNFDPNRFVVQGNGPSKPVCDEFGATDVVECRAQNRRTEFQILDAQ